MAYGRFRRRGFRRFRRRGGFRRFSRYRGINRAMRGYRRPTRMELKLRDATGSSKITTGSPIIQLLNGTTNGSNFWNRLGSRISMKSLWFKLFIANSDTYTIMNEVNATYRISIVYDKQAQGTAPLVSDIWANVDNAGALTSSITGSVNPLGRDRFVILFDRFINTWPLRYGTSEATSWVVGKNAMIKKYFKLKNSEALYNTGNTGTISDIESGSLYLIIQSSRAATEDNPFQFIWNTRLRWTD